MRTTVGGPADVGEADLGVAEPFEERTVRGVGADADVRMDASLGVQLNVGVSWSSPENVG